jgi:hypothetical protein
MADTGVIVGSVLGGIIGGISLVLLGVQVYTKGIPNILKILYYFLPYFLILFSFFNDIILEGNMYWPAPLVALGAVMVNALASRGINGALIPESDLCGLPGLSRFLPSNLMPQIIVFSSTILAYIASFNTGIGNTNAVAPSWVMFAVIPIIQWIVLTASGTCFESYFLVQKFGSVWGWGTASSLLALGLGLFSGGLAGGLLAGSADFRKLSPSGSPLIIPATLGPSGITPFTPPPKKVTSDDPNVGTCSAPNDQDQFVCEAYKNGELVTSTITESFIGK